MIYDQPETINDQWLEPAAQEGLASRFIAG